jgi:hypothetical protein
MVPPPWLYYHKTVRHNVKVPTGPGYSLICSPGSVDLFLVVENAMNCSHEQRLECPYGLFAVCATCEVNKGLKFDSDKPRWDLLPLEPIKEVVDVLTFGAKKYGPHNWRNVQDAHNRYYSALMRHIVKFESGEANDPETGLSHLAHAMCNLVFLYELSNEPAKADDTQ